jgi:ABC-2 type transport system ATP-binding protein
VLSSQQLFEVEKVADDVLFLKNGAPRLLEKENQNTKNHCVVELETSASREEIVTALHSLTSSCRVHFNGGMYVISTDEIQHANSLLQQLIQGNIPVHYFRDISGSSKRFFVT